MAAWTQLFLATALLAVSVCHPLRHETPLEVGSALASHLPATHMQEPRLPLPTPQELEAIKKVAQILVMLGEQVIPSIIGEPPSGNCCDFVDAPVDPVEP